MSVVVFDDVELMQRIYTIPGENVVIGRLSRVILVENRPVDAKTKSLLRDRVVWDDQITNLC